MQVEVCLRISLSKLPTGDILPKGSLVTLSAILRRSHKLCLIMSFGWSAGDIAQAISLIVKVARALDSVDGAASDYREAVSFLASLRRTLEPLQTLSALRIHPSYSVEIQQVVGKIKDPIEQFLAITEGFEPALGPNPQPGRQYNVGRKLQWRFVTSKRVIELRRNIEAYIGILNNLLHQVTM